jgi:DNA-binding LytR/AlgR family response regulator
MEKIKVLIVDDEPIAQDILETYISKIADLQLTGKCRNALEAFQIVSKQQVDLILLDINMPEISGIDFLKTLKNAPLVIFTTAYSEYALQSYELDAVDYLLKPIPFDRFLKAINKVIAILNNEHKNADPKAATATDNTMFVKADGKLIKIDLAQLWFVEGLKDYIKLWTSTGKIVLRSTMTNIEETLSAYPNFVRIHKSYIINLNHISEVDGNMIRIKDQVVTIGNTYKDEVQALLNKFKLL